MDGCVWEEDFRATSGSANNEIDITGRFVYVMRKCVPIAYLTQRDLLLSH